MAQADRFQLFLALLLSGIFWEVGPLRGQAPSPPTPPPCSQPPVPILTPSPTPCERPLPINLPTALRLVGVRSLDVAYAASRIREAVAQFDQAKVLWLPNIDVGGDYLRHDGQIEDQTTTLVVGNSHGSLMVGAGPSMVFALTDAIFEPLATHQLVQARNAAMQTVTNDTTLYVAVAYFNMQQARGELAGALEATRRAEDVFHRAEQLAPGMVPPFEATRARVELRHQRQTVDSARERWRIASADFLRLLHLEPGVVVEPLEPPYLEVSLVPPGSTVDDLIAEALVQRPELAQQQALVQVTLARLKEEKLRPFLPSVLLRGTATNPTGTLSSGFFGGGANDIMHNFSWRNDMDLQVLWELQNLGFGNLALVHQRQAQKESAVIDLYRVQDRVAAEVSQAHAEVVSAASRLGEAEGELKDATELVERNLEGMGQTKRTTGNITVLLVRPQEAVAAVQELAQAYTDYFGAVADYNRAQFRLYRALGNPVPPLGGEGGPCDLGVSPAP